MANRGESNNILIQSLKENAKKQSGSLGPLKTAMTNLLKSLHRRR